MVDVQITVLQHMFKLVSFNLETQTNMMLAKVGSSMAGGIKGWSLEESSRLVPCQFCIVQSVANFLFHLYDILWFIIVNSGPPSSE
jgi:hypothetical protein